MLVDRRLAIKVCIFNTVGLALVIVSPMILDPRLTTDFQYHDTRRYSLLLLLLLLLCPVVFVTTYLLLDKTRPVSRNLWLPLLPLGIPAALIGGFAFNPEVPHDGALLLAFGYGLISFCTIFLRQARETYDYLYQIDIDHNLRLERLKATIAFWQQLTVYGVTAYLAFVIVAASMVWTISEKTVGLQAEQLFLWSVGLFELLLLSMFVIVGPLSEALTMTLQSIEKLSKIPK